MRPARPPWIRGSRTALLLVAVVAISLIGVVYRFGLVDPIGWTGEAMRYAVVWATFLARTALWRCCWPAIPA